MPYILGLDLATKKDYSALSIIEVRQQNGYNHFGIKFIERLPHGISYPKQIAHVRNRVNTPLKGGGSLRGAALAVDQTGVGEAVVDMLREDELAQYVSIWPILITGGVSDSLDESRYCYHVAKRNLVSVVSKLFESGRITMVPGLAHEQTLKNELPNFKAKITAAGNEVFEAWRDSDHDDLKSVRGKRTHFHVDGMDCRQPCQQAQMPGDLRRRKPLEVRRWQPAKVHIDEGRIEILVLAAD